MRTYEEETGMDELFRPSPGELIIGGTEAKRSTKTYISSERLAIALQNMENFARTGIQTLQALHEAKYGEKLEAEEIVKRYRGVRRWVQDHQGLVEHFASSEGFSVQAIVSMEKARWQSQNRAESSTDPKE